MFEIERMPPAKRRKVGLKRIDAALDALRPMGFSSSVVRKTLRKLLQAYGGDDGWTFIEDSSYKLLIETILEELHNSPNGNDGPNLPTEDDGSAQDHIVHSPTSKDAIPSASRVDDPGKKLEADTPSLPEISSASAPSSPRKTETVQSCSKEKLLGSVNSENVLPPPQVRFEVLQSPTMCSPSTVESLPPSRRKPCYGWLSSDDEDEPDLVSQVTKI